jgi:hypothetical protein
MNYALNEKRRTAPPQSRQISPLVLFLSRHGAIILVSATIHSFAPAHFQQKRNARARRHSRQTLK